MNDLDFNDSIDNIFMSIEEQLDKHIDEQESDIDYETSSGILTLIMPNQSQIILNRQRANHQLWMASKSGGYHFVYNEKSLHWENTRNKDLFIESLNTCIKEQCDENILIKL